MAESALRVVLMTAPNGEVAREIARTLVAERLAACVNIVPGVESIYRWEGKVEQEAEVLLIAKTREECCAGLEKRVGALHPYEVPEIVCLPIEGGSSAYMDWVRKESKQ